MESIANIERDCNAISNLFQVIVNDMKGSSGQWEDLVMKGTKFHTQLKATITASTAFLDAFQRIADLATSTRGGTKEIGSALTRLCLRHRSVEAKLKTFTSSLMDCLILPLSDRLEEWKKTTNLLDKDHSKEMKRLKAELKKGHHLLSSSSTLKSKRRMKAGRTSFASGSSRSGSVSGSSMTGSMSTSMSSGMESVEGSEKLFLLEEMEKRSLRRALIEERSRFCLFVNFLRPVIEEELAMINEIHYLEEIMDNLALLTTDPYILPQSPELVISDHLKLNSINNCGNKSNDIYGTNNYKSWSQMNVSEPNSPPGTGFGSRKNSMCSISSFASNSNSDGRSDSPSSVIYASTGGHRRSQQRGHSAPRCHSLSARGYEDDHNMYQQGHRESSGYAGHYNRSISSATNGTVIPIGVPTVPNTTSQPSSNKTSPQEVISGGHINNYGSHRQQQTRNSYSTNSSPTIHSKGHPDFRQVGTIPSNLTRSSISVIDTSNHQYDRGQLYDQIDGRGHTSYQGLDPRSTMTYANSGSGDWTSTTSGSVNNDTAYSEGSITPTNPERSVSPVGTSSAYHHQQPQSYIVNPDGQYNDYRHQQESQRLISSSSSSSVSSASQAAGHPSSIGQVYSGGQSGQPQRCQPVIVPSLPSRNSNTADQQIYSSATLRSKDRPPPPPLARRTSAISDPNAITLGTLKSTGCSTYEEVKRKSTLNLSNYEDPIYCNLNLADGKNSNNNGSNVYGSSNSSHQESGSKSRGVGNYPTDHDRISAILQKHHRSSTASSSASSSNVVTNSSGINTMASILGNDPRSSITTNTSSSDGSPLPSSVVTSGGQGPPGHGKINVHKDFLQSLNDKLSIPVSQRMSPKLTKRRSMSVGEHEWDSDSGIVTLERDRDSVGDRSNPNSATSSISSNSNPLQQSLMRLMSSSMSTSSNNSSSRPSSATSFSQRAMTSMSSSTTGETYTAFTITSNNGGNGVTTVCSSSSSAGAAKSMPLTGNNNSNLSSANSNVSKDQSSNNRMCQVDPTMEIAKAAADIAKRRMEAAAAASSAATSAVTEGGHHSIVATSNSTVTSTSVVTPCHQSIHQDTYSATPVRVEYSPTHQPTQPSIINPISTPGHGNESGKNYRPLPAPPNTGNKNQRPSGQQQSGVKSASVVVINASTVNHQQQRHQQQFVATHHASLDIKVPSDASIHNNGSGMVHGSIHNTSNGSIMSMTKRGSLPAVIHRPSAGQVFSEAIGSFENAITSRVNNWLSTATSRSGSVDLTSNLAANLSNCKETLMDQIKKGIQLKKVDPGSPSHDN